MRTAVDDYIAGFPPAVRKRLREIRAAIRQAAPEASEGISYQIPTYKLDGMLVSFAAFRDHIGLYPAPGGSAALGRRLAPYRSGKASLHFPLDQPIPAALVAEVVAKRVHDHRLKASRRATR